MAVKVPRLFVPVDVDLDTDPYIAAGGPWAELLWIRCLRWSKKRPELRGYIPATAVDWIGQGVRQPAQKLNQLLATPLPMHESCTKPPLLRHEGGWKIRSWDAWNQTPEEQAKSRDRKRIGGLITAHKHGYHKKAPEPDCPICTAKASYSSSHSSSSSKSSSSSSTSAEEEGIPYGNTSSRTDGPEGGRRRSGNWPHYDEDWYYDTFRPTDYLIDEHHRENGGWWPNSTAWVQPAVWRDGWNGNGKRPPKEGHVA